MVTLSPAPPAGFSWIATRSVATESFEFTESEIIPVCPGVFAMRRVVPVAFSLNVNRLVSPASIELAETLNVISENVIASLHSDCADVSVV